MFLKAVIQKEEAETFVVSFEPKKFPTRVSDNAQSFHRMQTGDNRTDFRLDPSVAQTTGIGELERISIEEKVEIKALEKLKEIQEDAYAAGYKFGVEEGNKKAFEETKAELIERIDTLDSFLIKIDSLKQELLAHNESFIMELLFHMAQKIAMDEIKNRPEVILSVMKEAIQSAQTEEKVQIFLNLKDFQFVNSVKDQLGKEFDFLKNVKLDSSEDIQVGGCKIETNYGVINASLEQRISKLWESLYQKLPRVESPIGDQT